MLETTDTLLKGLAEGDQNRWARFYRDYAPLIERTLTKHGISHEDAEEAIQETLVDLVKIMPSYKYDKARNGAFHSLLFKIAQNKAVDWMRKAKADADKIARFAAEPIVPAEEDWRLETFKTGGRERIAAGDGNPT